MVRLLFRWWIRNFHRGDLYRLIKATELYETDIVDLQEQHNDLWIQAKEVLKTLADIQGA